MIIIIYCHIYIYIYFAEHPLRLKLLKYITSRSVRAAWHHTFFVRVAYRKPQPELVTAPFSHTVLTLVVVILHRPYRQPQSTELCHIYI